MEELKVAANRIARNMPYFSLDLFEKELYKGDINPNKSLEGYYNEYIDSLKKKRSIRTADGYRHSLQSLTSFNGGKAPDFFDINVDWLAQYKLWMADNDKSVTTASIYLRNLRTIFNQAISDKSIPEEMYPFGKRKFVIPEPSGTKTALKIEDVRKLIHGKPNNEYQHNAKAFWLFSFFSNGLYVSDIAYLKYKNKDGDKISF